MVLYSLGLIAASSPLPNSCMLPDAIVPTDADVVHWVTMAEPCILPVGSPFSVFVTMSVTVLPRSRRSSSTACTYRLMVTVHPLRPAMYVFHLPVDSELTSVVSHCMSMSQLFATATIVPSSIMLMSFPFSFIYS